jgi:hypothetical protein
MDAVEAIAVVGEQTQLGGSAQQHGERVVVGPGERGHRVVPGDIGIAHESQRVNVDDLAKQVYQR